MEEDPTAIDPNEEPAEGEEPPEGYEPQVELSPEQNPGIVERDGVTVDDIEDEVEDESDEGDDPGGAAD